MDFQIGTETISRSYDVSDASKNTSITKIMSALKEMRQNTDQVLSRFVEAEKIADNNENTTGHYFHHLLLTILYLLSNLYIYIYIY